MQRRPNANEFLGQDTRAVRDSMRPEYEFDYATAVRGKYYRRLLPVGANVVARLHAVPTGGACYDQLRCGSHDLCECGS